MPTITQALLTQLWWLLKVALAILGSGWWLHKQVSRIVEAVKAVPELKRKALLHDRQIHALAFAGKTVATVAFFPTHPTSKKEHLDAIGKFDEITRMKVDDIHEEDIR